MHTGSVLHCRYDDLVAQGVSLRHFALPSSSSLESMSQASSDLAPDTPKRAPAQAPAPPQAQPPHNVGSAAQQINPDQPSSALDKRERHSRGKQHHEMNGHANGQHVAVGEAVIEMQTFALEQRAGVPQGAKQSQANAHAHRVRDSKALDSSNGEAEEPILLTNESENDPLLANSASNVLSDKPAQSEEAATQGLMLHVNQEADDAAEKLGMTPVGLKAGIRSAVVAMNLTEGPSESATEAVEAFEAAGPSPAVLGAADGAAEESFKAPSTTAKADSKGRIMKASFL